MAPVWAGRAPRPRRGAEQAAEARLQGGREVWGPKRGPALSPAARLALARFRPAARRAASASVCLGGTEGRRGTLPFVAAPWGWGPSSARCHPPSSRCRSTPPPAAATHRGKQRPRWAAGRDCARRSGAADGELRKVVRPRPARVEPGRERGGRDAGLPPPSSPRSSQERVRRPKRGSLVGQLPQTGPILLADGAGAARPDAPTPGRRLTPFHCSHASPLTCSPLGEKIASGYGWYSSSDFRGRGSF